MSRSPRAPTGTWCGQSCPIGGPVGAQLRQMLTHPGLDTIEVAVAGEVRSNVSLTQTDETVTKMNEPAPAQYAASG